MKTACVLLADGFEETEAVTVIDVLRRAGIGVEVLGVTHARCTGSHRIVIEADALLSDRTRTTFDVIVLPGGMPGASTLRDSPAVQAFIRSHAAAGKWLAAICAAPIALARAGVLSGRRATCYPGFESELAGAHIETEAVVRDGRILTSRGVGTALAFSIALVEALTDGAMAEQVASKMLVA